MPICTCGKVREGIILTKKPLSADENELKLNPRAGSAKLRILEKI
jgi:16S rRNA (cytosine1402-N4)-methyltransferase